MAKGVGLAVVISLLSVPVRAEFSLVVLPDTQRYSDTYPHIFVAQTQWIADNVETENIAFVLHEGDVIERVNVVEEWENADAALSILDGVVPYTIAVGNHDMGSVNDANDRDTTMFNSYFPVSRYEHEPWYGGHMGDDNHYCFFSADGLDFMIVSLEFGADDETLQWANEIVADHPEKRVIVLTHAYLNPDDTRVVDDVWLNPHWYGINATGANDGQEMWEKFVERHANIFLVLSGHMLGDGRGRLTSSGIHGNPVHQILANYQTLPEGGRGWLRILRFQGREDSIQVTTYSPWLDEFATDEQNAFVLSCGVQPHGGPLACKVEDDPVAALDEADGSAELQLPEDIAVELGGPCGVGTFGALLAALPGLACLRFRPEFRGLGRAHRSC